MLQKGLCCQLDRNTFVLTSACNVKECERSGPQELAQGPQLVDSLKDLKSHLCLWETLFFIFIKFFVIECWNYSHSLSSSSCLWLVTMIYDIKNWLKGHNWLSSFMSVRNFDLHFHQVLCHWVLKLFSFLVLSILSMTNNHDLWH